MKHNSTELALNFLCKRNPFDDTPQFDYVFAIMNFHDKKGDEAVEALAGFYCWMIDNKKGVECSLGILSTFAHDIHGANDPTCALRSSDYLPFWKEELKKRYPGFN